MEPNSQQQQCAKAATHVHVDIQCSRKQSGCCTRGRYGHQIFTLPQRQHPQNCCSPTTSDHVTTCARPASVLYVINTTPTQQRASTCKTAPIIPPPSACQCDLVCASPKQTALPSCFNHVACAAMHQHQLSRCDTTELQKQMSTAVEKERPHYARRPSLCGMHSIGAEHSLHMTDTLHPKHQARVARHTCPCNPQKEHHTIHSPPCTKTHQCTQPNNPGHPQTPTIIPPAIPQAAVAPMCSPRVGGRMQPACSAIHG